MRKIMFKALDFENNWIFGDLQIIKEDAYINYKLVQKETISEYTGLSTRFKEEIYENDLFEIPYEEDRYDENIGHTTETVFVREFVKFKDGMFKLGIFPLYKVLRNNYDLKLIGNIHISK